jgi:hypothetical protein
MTEFVRIILAKGDTNWIEILIPVVFVIVYALSGIAKAMSNKQQEKGDKVRKSIQPSRGRPAGVQERPGVRGRPEGVVERERAGAAAPRDERGAVGGRKQGVLELMVESAMAKASAPPRVPPKPPVTRRIKVGGGEAVHKPAVAVRKYSAEEKAEPAVKAPGAFASLRHLGEKDNLRMAIVYAEILGKPVGLRDM